MALTEKKKEEIIESHKRLAQEQFELRQDRLESILRNYNLERVNTLRKSRYIRDSEIEDNQESQINN